MKKILFALFAIACLLHPIVTSAQSGGSNDGAAIAASTNQAEFFVAPASAGDHVDDMPMQGEAMPEPVGEKLRKTEKKAFHLANFKLMCGYANSTGGENAPFTTGVYADLGFIARAFKKKGAFEFLWGTDILNGSKSWGAKSVGVPVDSVTGFGIGSFDMFTEFNFYWTVYNGERLAFFAGLSTAGVWGVLPDVKTTIGQAHNTFEDIFLFTAGPKVSAAFGHLAFDAQYILAIPGSYSTNRNPTEVRTSIPMNNNKLRIGIGLRL